MSHVIGVVHTGIAVTNLEVSIPFYRDILGFDFVKLEEKKKSRGDLLGVPGAEIQVAIFVIPGTNQSVELIQYFAPRPMLNYGVPVNTPGCAHLALKVDDIQAAIDEFKSKGVGFCSDHFEVIKSGPLAGWKWIYFKDPDGTNLELIEESELK